MNNFVKILRRRVLILDGGVVVSRLPVGHNGSATPPCVLNISSPVSVVKSHEAYVAAGSDIILTNTVGANERYFDSKTVEKIIRKGVLLAQSTAKNSMVFGSVGPLGDTIMPYGTKDFEDSVKEYRRIFKVFTRSGLRRFFLTAFTSLIEAKAAFLAAREYAESILVCFSLKDKGYGSMNESPEAVALTFEGLGADGVGVNCTSPDIIVEVLSKMRCVSELPLIAKPDAGQATVKDGVIKCSMLETELIPYYRKFVEEGASIVGGCCGTSPDYIKAIAKEKSRPQCREFRRVLRLASPERTAEFAPGRTYIVGERLNPSGRKKVMADLKRGVYRVYGDEAKGQELAGADAIDINAFVDVLAEKDTLAEAVRAVMKKSSLPLFIDTQDYEAAEIVLRFYPGIGVYNSIPSRRSALKRWLPMVRRYGFKAVISLVGKRLPVDSQERIQNARLAMRVAREVHFPSDGLIFDPLVLPIATNQDQLGETLRTLEYLHRMKLRTILGVSNVSYGLPSRSQLNAALVAVAAYGRTTFVIANPLDSSVMGAVGAANALCGSVLEYIEEYRTAQRFLEAESDK